jgi:hypothetical protein
LQNAFNTHNATIANHVFDQEDIGFHTIKFKDEEFKVKEIAATITSVRLPTAAENKRQNAIKLRNINFTPDASQGECYTLYAAIARGWLIACFGRSG